MVKEREQGMRRLEIRLVPEDLEIGDGIGIEQHRATLCEGRKVFGPLKDGLQLEACEVLYEPG